MLLWYLIAKDYNTIQNLEKEFIELFKVPTHHLSPLQTFNLFLHPKQSQIHSICHYFYGIVEEYILIGLIKEENFLDILRNCQKKYASLNEKDPGKMVTKEF